MQRLLKVINILIILFILIAVAVTVRILLTPVKTPHFEKPEDIQPHGTGPQYPSEVFLERNPFGIKDSGRSIKKGKSAPTSTAGLTLTGTVYDRDNRGFAVFKDTRGTQWLYRTGQEIPGLGKLIEVRADRVIIKENSSLLELPLIDIKKTSKTDRRISLKKNYSKKTLDEFIKKTSSGEYILDRFKVQQAIENPEQLLTDARLQPAFRKGRQYGFVLKEVRPGGIYYRLGLRNNDILLKINEFEITDPEAALRAFTELRGAEEITLHILRNGKEQTLKYIIQ